MLGCLSIRIREGKPSVVVRELVRATIIALEMVQIGTPDENGHTIGIADFWAPPMGLLLDKIWQRRPPDVQVPHFRLITSKDDPQVLQWARWVMGLSIRTLVEHFYPDTD